MRKKLAYTLLIVSILSIFIIYTLKDNEYVIADNSDQLNEAFDTLSEDISDALSEETTGKSTELKDNEDKYNNQDKLNIQDKNNNEDYGEDYIEEKAEVETEEEAVDINASLEDLQVYQEVLEIEGLVELTKIDPSFIIDIKYAGTDNFTGKKVYSSETCLINKNTAKKLIEANNDFMKLGYTIKVFDAYRPYSAQKVLWDAAPDKSYLASPVKGSIHNRGAAIDLTLVDSEGNDLEMPSGYDEMTKRSHLDYKDCDEQLIKNRELLGSIMVKHGFKRIRTEWWHFEDTDAKNCPILDISFESFTSN